ncbi:hypothetical protein B0J13DRAFT_583061 [Dactylonectria estremocensis]|uniref:DNase1 protein n=1 Tax=Dactylonectria estremocensis TaxID=1079267 RepID=A0A9P9F323_9HYPO|nr:hypothetical protein B0J13DRAFT_583061 [Dactylonectria estremocensis]
MQFATALLAFAATFTTVAANTVTFWTLDDITRTIVFTPSSGHVEIESVTVNSKKNTTVTFPEGYIGNYYAVQKGANDVPGMLGEVTFGGWAGKTYFDVSAIVDPSDHDNVKQMWPASGLEPMSGCEVFPCNNAYYLPDDVQTKVTDEVDLISTLGTGSVYTR